MNILAIGNSFSQDATRYLHDIARSDGVDLQVANLYIGGCSLERHYRNMLSGERAYELHYNGHETGFSVSLQEALLNRAWDVVTLQQASHYSFLEETYIPYALSLTEFVEQYAPKARIFIHQTWAYEDGSERLRQVAGYPSAEAMFADIKTAYASVSKAISADGIIPSGQMFHDLLTGGIPKIHRDTFHASYGLGRYALALLWYRVLCGKPVSGNSFCDFDEPISAEEIRTVKSYVDAQPPIL